MAINFTYVPISTQTLSSATASVTFSSIPSTYQDLVLVTSNVVLASSGNGVKIQFNGDTASNYSYTVLYGNGSSAGSFRVSNVASSQIGWGAVGSSTSPANIITSIQNYSNASTYKTFLARSNDASTETDAIVGLWKSTSAINSITIFPSAGNFTSATATLYGISAA